MAMETDLLIHARWIIPVEPDNAVLEHAALAINDGRIREVLSSQEARKKYTPLEEIDLASHVLIPGLINAHTHAAMSLFRGLADDLPLMDWLNNHIWPSEQRWISPGFVTDGTELAIAEMLRGGTTCFNDMYFFPDHTADVAINAGIRAVIGLIMIDFPTAWANDAQEYFAKGIEVHDKYKHHTLINTAFAPHAPYTVSDEPLKKICMDAEELNIPVHMHVHETWDEIEKGLEQHGKRPLQRLYDLGLLNERLMAVHMTQLEVDEIDLVAKYGVSVLHCPESNLKLASGFCPVNDLLDAGVNVALGTDGAASNNDLDMFGEMRTAALLAKGVSGDCSVLPAHTALRMATLNAARALGIDDITGSLTAGKEADIVAVDLDRLETQPVYNPVSHIVYSCNRSQVTDVWVAGKRVLKDRELTTLDPGMVVEKAKSWEGKIRSRD